MKQQEISLLAWPTKPNHGGSANLAKADWAKASLDRLYSFFLDADQCDLFNMLANIEWKSVRRVEEESIGKRQQK